MLRGNIKSNGVIVETVDIPENENEWKYSQWLEYYYLHLELQNWLSKQKQDKPYFAQYVTKVSQACSSVLGIDPKILANLSYNDAEAIFPIWKMLDDSIVNFDPYPDGEPFRINGKWYEIPTLVAAAITGNMRINGAEFTMQQIVEIGRIEQKLGDAIARIEKEEDFEENGNKMPRAKAMATRMFLSHMRKIAICLCDPEEIPNDSTFDVWLDEKVKEIKDISLRQAANTIFFLTNIPKGFKKLIVFASILNRSNYEDTSKNQTKTTQQGRKQLRKLAKTLTKKSETQVITSGS